MIKPLNIETFQALLNEQVAIHFSKEVTLKAELIEVKATAAQKSDDYKSFTILFRTDQKTEYYEQGTFKVAHKDLGELYMFLVPIGPDDHGMRYEAVFN